ncbi:DUF885 family protein [Fodinicola acaciae]|uniref:DUF885 family protein n=1 Tax=Fodinicola acaciae TaxID=2681555 RepID=UPI0013D6D74D|nr:DUF885 family protein [Fodinicola acaciae]
MLRQLAADFWTWRAATRPDNGDDLTRMERPAGWLADWSDRAVSDLRAKAADFTRRLDSIDVSGEPVAVRVDARLLRSAIDRVHWENDLLRGWQRHPGFYVDQAVIPIFEAMLPLESPDRAATVSAYLRHIPVIIDQAKTNLADVAAPFARLAIDQLDRLVRDLPASMAALSLLATDAVDALESYRDWLVERLPTFGASAAVGADAFGFFLHRVALYPQPADHIVQLARSEWQRAVAMEAVFAQRFRHVPPAPLAASIADQVATEDADEKRLRRFYAENAILSQPDDLRRYLFAPMPAYLAPLAWLAVPDDLTSLRRAGEDAIRYVPAPRDDLPYFERAKAYDPLCGGLIHEGVHAQQAALSWQHPDPVRRHYYDSLPSEGIAFYHEEMTLQAGLFADRPDSMRQIANFLRLRAIRAELDVELALGSISLDEAADRLLRLVPVDREMAFHDATGLAARPGQRLSYQAGKQQILDLLASARVHFGDSFDLRRFHDRLWSEGNVPIALQRWELLGDPSQLAAADRLAPER